MCLGMKKLTRMIIIDEVDIDVDGTIVHDWCNVFINGTGFLNSWKCMLRIDLLNR